VGEEAFRAEREQLLAGVVNSPVTEMRCCYARSWGGVGNSLFDLLRARPVDSVLTINLYPAWRRRRLVRYGSSSSTH
jgi:hypothetical protein